MDSMNMTDPGDMSSMPGFGYYDYHDRCVIAHAVLGAVALFFVLPTALFASRFRDEKGRSRWFRIHILCNAAVVVIFTICFSLGTASVIYWQKGSQFTGSWADIHHKLGLITFLLVWAQAIYGFAHSYFIHAAITRTTHVAFGLVVIGVMFATYFSGLDEWNVMSDVSTKTPQAVYIASWLLLGALVAIYTFGLSWRPPKVLIRVPVRGADRVAAEPLLEKQPDGMNSVAQCGC